MKKWNEWKNLSHFVSTALPKTPSLMSSGKSLKIYVGLSFSGSFCTWSTCHINCPDMKDQVMLCAWIPSIHLINKFWDSRANWIISHAFFFYLQSIYILVINLPYLSLFLQRKSKDSDHNQFFSQECCDWLVMSAMDNRDEERCQHKDHVFAILVLNWLSLENFYLI